TTMRAITLAATLLVACTVTPAEAQGDRSGLAGTWGFQTEPYGNLQFSNIMSGVAILTPSGSNRYDIRLVANERIIMRMTGRSRILTARQTCTAHDDGGQITINCQMAEPLEGYEPDDFVLQRGEDADQLVGVLSSANSGQVVFTRV